MRKLLTIIVYTILVLLIGRNLVSLPRFTVFSNPDTYTAELKKETEKIITDKKGNYGVSFLNIKTHETFGINEDEQFTAASVNKVPIVAVLYALEHQGKVDFDEQITLQENDIQDYGTGSLRYQKTGTTYSLKTLAKLALKESDNTAAHILNNKIGVEKIQLMINEWGLTQTKMDENITSPSDMQTLFLKIYNHEVTSEGKTKELLGFMQDTEIEDRIPSLLPKGAVVSHKTGDAVGSLHDVGIITKGDTSYFLAVMTSDIGTDEQTTKTTIAKIAQNILSFYDKRN